MRNWIIRLFLHLCIFAFLFLILPSPTRAQIPDFNVAVTHLIDVKVATTGDVMSLVPDKNTLVMTSTPNDDNMFGVISDRPVIVYRTIVDGRPIVRSGETPVNVTTINGPIARGDFVTSSIVPGKAQKAADKTGFMLGRALEPFTGETGTEFTDNGKTYKAGQILVAVGIGPASPIVVRGGEGLLGSLRQISGALMFLITTSNKLDKLLKIIIAALIIITTLILNYRAFGRNITKGIEGIGRNPLAKGSIQFMIILNIIMIVIVSAVGLTISLVILSL